MIVRTEILIAIALGALTLLSLTGLWLMIRRPQRWTLWVERENDFWRDKGVISSGTAEKLKRVEKGRTLKVLAGLAALAGLVGFSLVIAVLVQAAALKRHKSVLPYNPVLQTKPGNPPPPKPNQ